MTENNNHIALIPGALITICLAVLAFPIAATGLALALLSKPETGNRE